MVRHKKKRVSRTLSWDGIADVEAACFGKHSVDIVLKFTVQQKTISHHGRQLRCFLSKKRNEIVTSNYRDVDVSLLWDYKKENMGIIPGKDMEFTGFKCMKLNNEEWECLDDCTFDFVTQMYEKSCRCSRILRMADATK